MKNTIKNTVQEIYGSAVENASTHFSPSLASNVSANNSGVGIRTKMMPDHLPSTAFIPKTDNTFVYVIMVFVLSLFALGWYFKDTLLTLIRGDKEVAEEIEEEDDEETEEEVEEEVEEEKVPSDETIDIKDKNESKDKNVTSQPPLSQQYSQSQLVGEDVAYCYLGIDNNMRECAEVYTGEVCTSGDIYKRVDECLISKK